MIHAPFPVVLDANVLIPLTVCDTLLSAAHEGLIQIHWTELILEETRRNLVSALGLSEAKAARRVAAMKAAFPEALVTGHEGLIASMTNSELKPCAIHPSPWEDSWTAWPAASRASLVKSARCCLPPSQTLERKKRHWKPGGFPLSVFNRAPGFRSKTSPNCQRLMRSRKRML